MDHTDHVSLLRPAIFQPAPTQTWADIGAGSGAFTLALADLLGPGASLVAIDRDRGALEANARSVAAAFPQAHVATLVTDFRTLTRDDLPELDGIVAANSLHYVPRAEQPAAIGRLAGLLRPGAPFIVVEYDADTANPWVPHPFAASSWPALAHAAGLVEPQILGRVPSRFLGAIYSASAHRPSE